MGDWLDNIKKTGKKKNDTSYDKHRNQRSRDHKEIFGNYGTKEFKKKKPGQSGKETSKDIPDWSLGKYPHKGESGKDFAERLLNEKYGKGNWKKGPLSEHNKLKKYCDRAFK